MSNFEHLMNLCREGKASPEEKAEFLRLASTGKYSHLLGPVVSEELISGFEETDTREIEALKAQGFKSHIQPHLPAEQVEEVSEGFPLLRWLMAAATVSVLLLAGVYWFKSDRAMPSNEITQNHLAVSTYTGPDRIQLPDGSTLTLNEGSELRIAPDFGYGNRTVFLTGEAFFDVKHDPTRQFIVHTGNVTTTVLGTAFNVRAFPGEEIEVTVARGLVQVESEKRIYGQIEPDHQITVKADTDHFVAKKIDASTETVWKDELLVLKNVTMQEAAKRVGEKFNLTVVITNEDLKQCKVNIFFSKGHELEKVLSVLASMTKATYRVEGNTAFIDGGRCD